MRLSRFYINTPLAAGRLDLPEASAHYISRVLRMQPGDPLQLFDGRGLEFPGVIVECSKKSVTVELDSGQPGLPESPLKVHLGQVLSRGERMDWAIQKATELGVSEITPLFSERCEVRLNDERAQKRLEHWQQIAISACEQSGRSKVPLIHPPLPVSQWQSAVEADLKLVLHPVASPLASHAPPQRLALLIGPEGGLSDAEVAAATEAGFHAACFGPRVLRTETAPVVALSLAQYLWGDFCGDNSLRP